MEQELQKKVTIRLASNAADRLRMAGSNGSREDRPSEDQDQRRSGREVQVSSSITISYAVDFESLHQYDIASISRMKRRLLPSRPDAASCVFRDQMYALLSRQPRVRHRQVNRSIDIIAMVSAGISVLPLTVVSGWFGSLDAKTRCRRSDRNVARDVAVTMRLAGHMRSSD